jgi:hypothetical protein
VERRKEGKESEENDIDVEDERINLIGYRRRLMKHCQNV